jgi:xanthine/uracil permease
MFQETLHNSILEVICVLVALVIGIIIFIFKGPANRSKAFQSKLLDVKVISHDTKIFTFGLPDDMKSVGLNIGEHLELE